MRHYLVSTDYLRMKFVSPVCAPKEPHPLVPPGSDLNIEGICRKTTTV